VKQDVHGINASPQPPFLDCIPTPIEGREAPFVSFSQVVMQPRHMPEQRLIVRLDQPAQWCDVFSPSEGEDIRRGAGGQEKS
jgi:hypothetical protein